MKKTAQESKGIFRVLLISYLIVYLIPALIGIGSTAYSYSKVNQYARQYQSLLLRQVRFSYDSVLKEMRETVGQLAMDSHVAALEKKTDLMGDPFAKRDLHQMLVSVYEAHPAFEECGIYYLNSDTIISNRRSYGGGIASAWFGRSGLSREEFLENSSSLDGILALSGSGAGPFLVYRNIYDNTRKRAALAFVVISSEKMRDTVLTTDPDGRFYVHLTDEKGFDADLAGGPVENRPLPEQKLGSELWGLNYGIQVPRAFFYRDMDRVTVILVVSLLAVLAAGLFAVRNCAKSSYMPFRQLNDILQQREKKAADAETGSVVTYRGLTDSLRDLVSDHEKIEQQLQQQEELRRLEVLAGFLRGSYPYMSWLEDFVSDDPHLCNLDSFRVVLFSFDHLEDNPFLQDNRDRQEQSYLLLMFALKNVVNEVLLEDPAGDGNGVTLDVGGMIASIIGCDDAPEVLQAKIERCIRLFEQHFRLHAQCSVSSDHMKWEELSAAYDEALLISGHGRYLEKSVDEVAFFGRSILAGDRMARDEGFGKLTSQTVLLEIRLINAVSAGNREEAMKIISEICSNCFRRDIQYEEYNRSLAVMMLNLICDSAPAELFPEDQVGLRQKNRGLHFICPEPARCRKLRISFSDWPIIFFPKKTNLWLMKFRCGSSR